MEMLENAGDLFATYGLGRTIVLRVWADGLADAIRDRAEGGDKVKR